MTSYKKNIEQTIGLSFEFLFADNLVQQKGLCQVYNELAEQAQGDYLCFCHEDMEFKTQN